MSTLCRDNNLVKALASAGHVYTLNIPEKLIYMQPAGFALTEGSNNGK